MHAVTIPGAIDSWSKLNQRFGSMPLAELLQPAIRYAEEGFAVTERVSTAPAGAFACALGGDDGRTLFTCLYTEQASQLADGAPPIGSVVTMLVNRAQGVKPVEPDMETMGGAGPVN